MKWFKDFEVVGLDQRLCLMLDQMRDDSMVPMIITCGKTTPEQAAAIGEVEDSAHIHGLAVDVRCVDSGDRMKLYDSARKVGFNRVGLYDHHIHLDIDETKPQDKLWVGKSK